MPYSGPDDSSLPADVKHASVKQRRAFVAAYNSAVYDQKQDEGHAMAIARAAMHGVHESAADEFQERDFTAEERRAMAEKGTALPDGSFPIATREDLMNAMHALGRASNRAAVVAHIRKRAAALGLSDLLPKGFGESERAGEPWAALLEEQGDLSGTELEEAEGGGELLKGVVLLAPGWSRNGRYYSREVVARSTAHWEGTRAFLDHPSRAEDKERPERSVRDLAGYYEGARVDHDGRAVADLRLLGMHAPHVSALAREARRSGRDIVGISINAVGKTSEGEAEGRKGQIVEDIVRGFSADIVTVPAAGGGFQAIRASADEETAALLAAASYQQWREVNPAHLERLREEMKNERQTDAIKRRDAEIAALKEATMSDEDEAQGLREQLAQRDQRIAELEAEQARRESVERGDRLLRESPLPAEWHDAVRPQLAGREEAEQRAILEAEQAKLTALRNKGLLRAVVTGAGQGTGGEEQSAQAVREVAGQLGARIDVIPLPDDDAYSYRERVRAATQNNGKGG